MKYIKLTKGKSTVVDDDDFGKYGHLKWYASICGNNYYAVRNGKTKKIYLHRLIMSGQYIDHINRDSLDNRKENLRKVTKGQNLMNRSRIKNNISGYKGVGWKEYNQKWLAQIGIGGKNIYLGIYEDIKEAARAYNKAAKKYHGEFAYLNNV